MFNRPARTRTEHVERSVRMCRHIGSHGYPFDEQAVRAAAAMTWDRDPHPAPGVGRHRHGRIEDGTIRFARVEAPGPIPVRVRP